MVVKPHPLIKSFKLICEKKGPKRTKKKIGSKKITLEELINQKYLSTLIFSLSSIHSSSVDHSNKKPKHEIPPKLVLKGVLMYKKGSSKVCNITILFDTGAMVCIINKDAVSKLLPRRTVPPNGVQWQVQFLPTIHAK